MRTILIALAIVGLASPVMAQNAGQVARAVSGSSCPGCNLFQANFNGLERSGLNFSRARLRQADLSLTVLNRANFANADLRDIEAYGGVFSSANFAGADLTNASLVGVHLRGANFAGATLTGANLSGADLSGARGLTQGQLDRACGDATTNLPAGLHIPPC
ncbi:MAG: pentapeptide repeat-containing protein [Brevundimonas sp.]|uniref:pentapeptide repeat-containing protein n=1 Tax=Brevundimonas sp. TaxID=1871086 RepID=UPI003919424D